MLTWENREGRARNSETISKIGYHFSSYSEQLSEALSLDEDVIDPRIARSFRALIKSTDEYLRFYADSVYDYYALEKIGEKVSNRERS